MKIRTYRVRDELYLAALLKAKQERHNISAILRKALQMYLNGDLIPDQDSSELDIEP